ncbi:MAG: YbaB/EbfC family nucleoid-associated protein [Candidatus Marinimicrobia bacterium]|nr:YbaB/EbfC family nucleoid-associated protein [Candidatus Neomarinimicrobiota bacterium]|tara:strand:- start:10282 stop:10605 length:324 start_codon:yes stop_codon:yes gene_type:complete
MLKGNMSKLLKQAQEVQKNIEDVQNELSDLIVEADSGGGMIKVKANGKQDILEIDIDQDAINEDKEMLEDLIISAVNKALSKAQEASQEKMNAAAGGMMSGLKIPGM